VLTAVFWTSWARDRCLTLALTRGGRWQGQSSYSGDRSDDSETKERSWREIYCTSDYGIVWMFTGHELVLYGMQQCRRNILNLTAK
jgi:hypothetical protein